MTKPLKTREELEQLITDNVRKTPGCAGFDRASVEEIMVGGNTGAANWQTLFAHYGTADTAACRDALKAAVRLLQRDYDIVTIDDSGGD